MVILALQIPIISTENQLICYCQVKGKYYILIIIPLIMVKTIEQEIKETETKLKELKTKKVMEENKSDFIKIPELGIEIQSKIHHKDNSYDDLVKEFGKEFLEENLPTYAQLQFLRNSKKYCKKLNLIDTWEFVKQEDEISKKNGYVAGFCAYSDYCYLYWGRDSRDSYSYLGVRFVRKVKR